LKSKLYSKSKNKMPQEKDLNTHSSSSLRGRGGLNFHHHYQKPLFGLLVLIIMGGVYSYNKLKTGLFPDITFPKIKIIAEAGQQPVDKMMTTVTIPIENTARQHRV